MPYVSSCISGFPRGLQYNVYSYCFRIDFPFLVLLMSGGHCLLAVAESIDRFKVLGRNLDDAPGDAFDKVC